MKEALDWMVKATIVFYDVFSKEVRGDEDVRNVLFMKKEHYCPIKVDKSIFEMIEF